MQRKRLAASVLLAVTLTGVLAPVAAARPTGPGAAAAGPARRPGRGPGSPGVRRQDDPYSRPGGPGVGPADGRGRRTGPVPVGQRHQGVHRDGRDAPGDARADTSRRPSGYIRATARRTRDHGAAVAQTDQWPAGVHRPGRLDPPRHGRGLPGPRARREARLRARHRLGLLQLQLPGPRHGARQGHGRRLPHVRRAHDPAPPAPRRHLLARARRTDPARPARPQLRDPPGGPAHAAAWT